MLAAVALFGATTRITGLAFTPPPQFCDSVCNSSAGCEDHCYVDQFAFDQDQWTTCDAYGGGDAWESGYCAPPDEGTLWNEYIEPEIPSAPDVEPAQNSTEMDAWIDAVADIESLIGEDIDDEDEAMTFLQVMYSYGIYPEDPSGYWNDPSPTSTARLDPTAAPSIENDSCSATSVGDEEGSSIASMQSCTTKWLKTIGLGLGAVALGVVATAAAVNAIIQPETAPVMAKVTRWTAGGAAVLTGFAIDEAMQTCDR